MWSGMMPLHALGGALPSVGGHHPIRRAAHSPLWGDHPIRRAVHSPLWGDHPLIWRDPLPGFMGKWSLGTNDTRVDPVAPSAPGGGLAPWRWEQWAFPKGRGHHSTVFP